jgi:gliding motility-associated-like protein
MKHLFATLFGIFTCTLLLAQPANDDCAGIIDLGIAPFCSQPAQYTNVGATASNIDPVNNIPACFTSGGVNRDVWFQFTVPADGSILDFTVQVQGSGSGNGTLRNPQIAVYRGDCEFGGLSELACVSAPNGVNSISLDLFGLTPGLTYFLRINDYSPSATPNSGTFRLCVQEYVAEINMGEVSQSGACSGTLHDSGGPTNEYEDGEDLAFTICPQDFYQCLILNVETYETEGGFDFLYFFEGDDVSGTQITQLSGFGQNLEVQISAPECATIRFTSDGSVSEAGFRITWQCSPSPCTAPPITTCEEPVSIPTLPYQGDDLNNCFSGNSVNFDPCGSTFLAGNDYLFSYESAGDECISVTTSGTTEGVGLGVYYGCPDQPGSECISITGGGFFGGSDPSVSAAFLENPGTYFIMFSSVTNCSPFSIEVDTVTCPIILPPASTCDAALDISGCDTEQPEIIALNPGQGDPNFIVDGVNQGCFAFPQQNYAFFYFVAGADGKFGFTVQAANPSEASDIDINVWGPIDTPADICDHVSNEQPVRSTWTGGTDPTGLEDIHPVTGIVVTDDFDCGTVNTPGAGGDRFVRRLDVVEGQIYVIMLDDYGGAIESGGISIDFNTTTEGVLDGASANVTAGPDTSVCVGQTVQLLATGGEAYNWSDDPQLSCQNCPNPTVTLAQSTDFVVQIATTCSIINKTVRVKVLEFDLGPDVTVCNNAEFQLNENPFENVQYNWSNNLPLSCYDCPSPIVSGLPTGTYTVTASLTSPFCVSQDTLIITVIPGQQPQYDIIGDTTLCAGSSLELGGNGFPGTNYTWTAQPGGFVSNDANPTVAPSQNVVYFISATNASCPIPAIDSVVVTVNSIPLLSVANDTTICQGSSVTLGTTDEQNDVTYQWIPNVGTMTNDTEANPLVVPGLTTTYTLTATLGACAVTESVSVAVIPIAIQLNTPDTVRICQGTSVNMQAIVIPAGTNVVWSPLTNLQVSPNGLIGVATPDETTRYTITASVPGCTRFRTVDILVDSLPDDLAIMPADTQICFGQRVLLRTTTYEPSEYEYMDFEWTPQIGQLTPDSLLNMVVQPTETTIYRRITTNGACRDTATAVVNVIPLATITITPADPSVCPGIPVQLNTTYTPGVEEIEWSPATGLSCTMCDNPIATVTTTTTFTVEGNFMGCITTASVEVEIASPPTFQFPNDTQLCLGESITLNNSTDPTATYAWTSTDPNFNATTQAQPTVTPTQSATYTVVATNGCTSTGTVSVQVFDATLTASPDISACKNVPVSLTASGTLPGSFAWSDGQSGQAITVTPTATTNYSVVYTYGDGCTETDNVLVTISGEAPPLETPLQTAICPGQSITLNNGNVPTGATYTWTATPPDPTLAASAGNPTVAPTQNTTYNVTATQGNCTNTATINVTVQTATLDLGPDITICDGDAATLTANASVPGQITWNPGNISGNTLDIQPTANGIYTAVLEYGNNCTVTDQVAVTVVPSFTVNIKATPPGPVVGLGEELELIAEITPGANIQNYQFAWTQNGVTPIGTTQIITPIVSTTDDSIRYVVVVTSPGGCTRTESIVFGVDQPRIEVPNAFTPDGDGNNDVFFPLALKGSAELLEFVIYNRWGQKVYSAPAGAVAGDKAFGWNGKVDGADAPVDVYIWQLQYRYGDGALQAPRVGEVTLLR